jgi:hypothetical protein
MELEMTWSRAVRVWWALFWRVAVFSYLVDLFAGFFLSAIAARVHWPLVVAAVVTGVMAVSIILGVSLIVTKVVLAKDFGGFRLAALASNRPPEVFEDTPAQSK